MERKENEQTLANNIVISTRVHMSKMSTIRCIPLNSAFLGTYHCKCLIIGGKWLLCNYVLGMQALHGFQIDRCTLHVDNQKVSNGTRKQWKKKILKKNISCSHSIHPSLCTSGCWFTLAPYFGKVAPNVLNPYPTAQIGCSQVQGRFPTPAWIRRFHVIYSKGSS